MNAAVSLACKWHLWPVLLYTGRRKAWISTDDTVALSFEETGLIAALDRMLIDRLIIPMTIGLVQWKKTAPTYRSRALAMGSDIIYVLRIRYSLSKSRNTHRQQKSISAK